MDCKSIMCIVLLIINILLLVLIFRNYINTRNNGNIETFQYTINQYIKPEIYNYGYDNAMVTLYTDNIKDYSIHSIKNMKKYCLEHGITLYIFNEKLSNEIEHGCWNKIPAILYLMNHTKHKYIIWMDIDAVFNRLDISFDKFIEKYKNKDMIVCRDIKDRKYKFNSGVMIIKNNEWSKKIFEDTWNTEIRHGYNSTGDQVILKKTILEDGRKDNNYNEISGNKHTVLLPEREFNSYPIFQKDIDNGKFKGLKITDDDFIIHFMGHKSYDRIKYISEINKRLNIN